ncbi:MAG: GGDEF domain-containing protein [Lachnospiraceae bacterium]|nr:GGDEF domain-containing protein [Lachnospiraceae bacterium]
MNSRKSIKKPKSGEQPGIKKKQKTAVWQWTALFAAFIVVIITVLFDSSKKIMQRAEIMFRSSILQMEGKYAGGVSARLDTIRSGGELLVHLMETGALEPQQVQQYLEAFCAKEGIYEAVFVEKETVTVDFGGKEADLSQKDYYEKVMEAEESTVLCVTDEEAAEGKLFLFVVPFSERDDRILLYYPAEGLRELIDMSAETYRPASSALIDPDGMVILSAGEENPFFSGGDLFQNVKGLGKTEQSKLQNKMRNRDSGRMDLSAGGQEGVVFHVPAEEWVFVAVYDQNYIERQENLIWSDAWNMVLRVAGILVLFVIIYMVVNLIGKIQHEGDNKALVEKADTDQLTGLSNKIATERKIKEYMLESPKDLALMFVLDIDNFKKINDTMGHAFGDEVLRTLGRHIGENFRVTDIIGRTGGDEFTIFLKSLKDDSNTLSEAQKLVDFFKEFEAGEYVKYSATASIGAAVFPKDGADFETLYKAADQALYKAKERGKNQLAFYDDRDKQAIVQNV